MASNNGRPPRILFWAQDLTLAHELFHVNERQGFARTGVAEAQTWLNGRTAGSVADVNALLAHVPGKVLASSRAHNPGKEERAYGAGAPAYTARADAIRARGRAGEYPRAQPQGDFPQPRNPLDRPQDGGEPARAPAGSMQAKLVVGAVNDPLEHEADRVAEHVMRMPEPAAVSQASPLRISRKCAECEEAEQKPEPPALQAEGQEDEYPPNAQMALFRKAALAANVRAEHLRES